MISFIKKFYPLPARRSVQYHNNVMNELKLIRKKLQNSDKAIKALESSFNIIKQRTGRHLPEMPYTVLSKKHINNVEVYLDRKELIHSFPKNGVVAEIGVADGEHAQVIYDISNPSKLHLIDNWISEQYGPCENETIKRFEKQIAKGRVIINKGMSVDILQEFPDNYFDWVYIDTAHSYKVTSQELLICKSKVKHGGIISGHDYTMGNWNSNIKYGVIEAVYEFCVKFNWEIIALTMELNAASFAMREIELCQ